MSKDTIRTICIIVFVVVTLYYLSPLLFREYNADTDTYTVKAPFSFWTKKMLKLGLDLRGGMEINLYVDLSGLPANEHEDAVKAAVTIIQNRIDQFGVAEPIIQRVGTDKIIVQLPGVKDFQRAKDLIGKTAILEFRLVAKPEEVQRVITQMDTYLANNYAKYPYLNIFEYGTDKDSDLFATEDSLDVESENEWYSHIMSEELLEYSQMGITVSNENKGILQALLEDSDFQNAVPSGLSLVLGKEDRVNLRAGLPIYVLEKKADLTGNYLTNAETRYSSQNDFGNANRPYVSLRFSRDGSRIFERITGQNIQRQLAIVLDGVVYVAPVIQSKISGGEAQITGSFTAEECNDLVIVLKAGNLPAPVHTGGERIVGPSLGSDSIRQGLKAGLIGMFLVMVFMIVYYKFSGLIAIVVLILNSAFVFAALTFFEATLTLPGIAGMILTIGMAVDANVLIFERIKEELRKGKTVRNAIDDGYGRAFITIVDSNLTGLIVAAVLYQFGSGPIRGFAITYTIGITASMFTAIFVTKAFFDAFVSNKKRDSLSI